MTSTLVVADAVWGREGTDAVLITDERIQAIGVRSQLEGRADRISSHAGVIFPGLRDAHLHPAGLAASAQMPGVAEATDLPSLVALVSEHVARLAPDEAFIGRDLDDVRIGRLPTRHDLDPVTGSRPALLYRVCSHIAVANTAALDAAGIGPDSPDPPGGQFDRDAEGHPTGVLRETAISAVSSAVARSSPAPGQDDLVTSMQDLVSMGLTRIDAMVSASNPMWCTSGNELDDLIAIASDLPLRMSLYVITEDPGELERAAERISAAGQRIRFGGWKGFADGSLGGHTAALRQPYHDRPQRRGILRLRPERDLALIRTAVRLGGGAAVHAIGDDAVNRVLDLFAQARREGIDTALRVEHASLLDDALISRMADLGVTASVQPSFARSDASILVERLGSERASRAYPLPGLQEAGVEMLGGSDAPIEDPNPFVTMAAARREGDLGPVEAATLVGAGALEPGGRADLAVLDRDPLTATPDEIERTEVQSVYVEGRLVSSRQRR